MDLSFARKSPRVSVTQPVSYRDILADTDDRRRDAVRSFDGLAAILRGQDGQDPFHALAHVLATGACGYIEAARLAGCFNPFVARQLMVGKKR